MLIRVSYLLSIIAFLSLASNAWCQISKENGAKTVRVVEPDKKTDSAHAAIMDTEKFELGLYTGLLSVEDFNTNPVTGLSFVYHFSSKLYAELNHGSADIEWSTHEEINDQPYLAPQDRTFSYTTLSAGWQIFHGRSYFRESGKYNSGFYLTGGIGEVEFARNSNSSLVLGVSYRVVRTDWMLFHFDYRNHIFDRDFINDNKQTLNNELTIGLNFFF